MYSACRVGYPWPPCKRLYPRQKKGAPFRFRPKGRKLHLRFLLLPFPPETRFAELSGGSPRGGSGRRRRPGVPGVGAQKSRDGNAVTAFLASAQLPWRLSFPHFFVRAKKWGRRRHLPPLAQGSLLGSPGRFTCQAAGFFAYFLCPRKESMTPLPPSWGGRFSQNASFAKISNKCKFSLEPSR